MTAVPNTVIPGGPEGIVYVNPGSPQFSGPSVLISEWGAGSGRRVRGGLRRRSGRVDSARLHHRAARRRGRVPRPGHGRLPVLHLRRREPRHRRPRLRASRRADGEDERHQRRRRHAHRRRIQRACAHRRQRRGGESRSPGRRTGSPYTLAAGTEYTVAADALAGYALSISGDCTADGRVTPAEGVEKSCTVTADDPPPATLNVITHVVNDDGGGWIADDFTIHVEGDVADVAGSPQPGSESRHDLHDPARDVHRLRGGRQGLLLGTFSGAVAPARSRSHRASSRPARSPTGTSSSPDNGLVLESYGPSRTDFEWGLTESFLDRDAGLSPGRGAVRPDRDGARIRTTWRRASGSPTRGRSRASTCSSPAGCRPARYSAAEKTALHDFVRDGGTLIATTDDSGHTMVDAFGLTQGDGSGSPTENMITDPAHAIANGAFGTVTQLQPVRRHRPLLRRSDRTRTRSAAMPQGTTLAVIERGVLGPGLGRRDLRRRRGRLHEPGRDRRTRR